jgi:hypothetical protein
MLVLVPDRLSPLDASFLEIEEQDEASHMHIGWAMVFDPLPQGGAPTVDQVRAQLEPRLGAVPHFGARLSAPRTGGLAWPRWVRSGARRRSGPVGRRRGLLAAPSALLALLPPLRRGGGDFARFGRYAEAMLGDREPFIRKAIGWVLRDTAKRRPELVAAWLEPRAALASGVTVREAVKHLPPDRRRQILDRHRRALDAPRP